MSSDVTEVFIAEVPPEYKNIYREWVAKVHEMEANFPGFRGMFVQAPLQGNEWITFLQFDTPENLDRWLDSPERQQLLNEANPLVSKLKSHRISTPFGGWFVKNNVPAAWKQTLLVLLVLFPIVMLEMKYLNPLLVGLRPALAVFIGNAISVGLIAWPLMPIAISALKRFLNQKIFIFLILGLYLLEIFIFWNFL